MFIFRINSAEKGFPRVTISRGQTTQERLVVVVILHTKFKKVKDEEVGNYPGKPALFPLSETMMPQRCQA